MQIILFINQSLMEFNFMVVMELKIDFYIKSIESEKMNN